MRFMKRLAMSWRQRLITTSLLCLVLPSVTTLALTGIHTKNEFEKKAILKAEQSLEVAELYVSNLVHDMMIASNSIQYDSELITTFRTAYTKYNSDPSESVDMFAFKQITEKLNTITSFGERTYITILLPNGLYFTNYSTYKTDLGSMYRQPWLEELSKAPINTTHWLGAQKNYVLSEAEKSKNLITIVRTFQLYSKSPNAYIMISKPETQFHQIFSKYGPDQIMMLQDAAGAVLSQTDDRLIGQTVPSPKASGKDTLLRWNGADYFAVNHPLPFAGWTLQSFMSAKDVIGKFGNFINSIFILQILFFVVFSVVMYYLLRQFTRPITSLAKTAKKVEIGNLDVRSGIKGEDEVGHLGLSFDRMLERIQEMVRQIEWEQNRKRIAELELLQAQINPHFLFNTLNSIRLQVMMKGENEIANTIESLSTLLRMTINRNNEFLPLHEEVGTVEQYMKLMNFRHMEDVQFTTNLASDTLLESIPRFTLQPLIENAYIHGLQQKSGEISISSRKQGNSLYITVQDNGKGMTEAELKNVLKLIDETVEENAPSRSRANMSGIGLRNVHERLKIIYGSAYAIEVESSPGIGVSITLRLPLSVKEDEAGHVQSFDR
ncbi:histidine kinase [Paenibacillus hodogayensis]|uniref:histidine kinase n=1 Tax=Paenibacillus hodogayensis TaxID=279208 RepID=A0ABV5VTM0_9BACL